MRAVACRRIDRKRESKMPSFSVSSSVRGYHVYKDIWEATEGEVLPCTRELHNLRDPFAVAIMREGVIVGHVPKKISAVCSSFLRRSGSITCRTVGRRQYSSDLPQGGLEIPCILTFTAEEASLVDKVQNLLQQFKTRENELRETDPPEADPRETEETSNKKVKIEDSSQNDGDDGDDNDNKDAEEEEWLSFQNILLTNSDRLVLMSGSELNDKHINFAQELLRKQFPSLHGLRSSLSPIVNIGVWVDNYVQIFHCFGNHWVCASTVGCAAGIVHVYDLLYTSVSKDTLDSLKKIKCVVPRSQKQGGTKDCGLYAIATCTYLAFGKDPESLPSHCFEQQLLRSHLIFCLELKDMREFP